MDVLAFEQHREQLGIAERFGAVLEKPARESVPPVWRIDRAEEADGHCRSFRERRWRRSLAGGAPLARAQAPVVESGVDWWIQARPYTVPDSWMRGVSDRSSASRPARRMRTQPLQHFSASAFSVH